MRTVPIRLAVTPGQAHDNRLAGKLLSRLSARTMLLADRGFDADWIRELAAAKGAWANIPPKSNRSDPICFSPHLYRARNQVERFFNKIKHRRWVATRYDKLATNYLAFVQLASMHQSGCGFVLMSPRPSRATALASAGRRPLQQTSRRPRPSYGYRRGLNQSTITPEARKIPARISNADNQRTGHPTCILRQHWD